jgi:arginine-tRNA-protein transferase
MTADTTIKIYTTHPHQCSYINGREATTIFVDPEAQINSAIYTQLSIHGFRRSGKQLYKPNCEHCSACIPARIPVNTFKAKRGQRKIINKNADLSVAEHHNIDDEQFYALYQRYINERHRDGDMFPATREQYTSFLSNEWELTRYFGFYKNGQLLAVAVTDLLEDGLSAIYTFFDPDQDKRSLGAYAILWQIEEAQRRRLDYLYMGYWINECRKMSYKGNYRPIEVLIRDQWLRMT